jgi:hypothetical protein
MGAVERPLPGTLFFADHAVKVANIFGSGMGHFWSVGDEDGTFAVLRELPTEVTFVETTLSSSRAGAGTPIVIAYDPAKVRVHDH